MKNNLKVKKIILILLIFIIISVPVFASTGTDKKFTAVNNAGFFMGYGSAGGTKSLLISAYDKLDLSTPISKNIDIKVSASLMVGKEMAPLSAFSSIPEFLNYSFGAGANFSLRDIGVDFIDLSGELGLTFLKFISLQKSYEIMPYLSFTSTFSLPIEDILKVQAGANLTCMFNSNIFIIGTAPFISIGFSI